MAALLSRKRVFGIDCKCFYIRFFLFCFSMSENINSQGGNEHSQPSSCSPLDPSRRSWKFMTYIYSATTFPSLSFLNLTASSTCSPSLSPSFFGTFRQSTITHTYQFVWYRNLYSAFYIIIHLRYGAWKALLPPYLGSLYRLMKQATHSLQFKLWLGDPGKYLNPLLYTKQLCGMSLSAKVMQPEFSKWFLNFIKG